jgi:DNA repair protein RecO (recombination protein O)
LYDAAVDTLRTLGTPDVPTGTRLLRFEMVLLRELGYTPVLETCAGCRGPLPAAETLVFSAAAGGVVCGGCRVSLRGQVSLSRQAWHALRVLAEPDGWRDLAPGLRAELRRLFNQYISHLLGHRPRTMPYLGS